MANSKQLVSSLLTEHFRYTPLSLMDDIMNIINETTYRAVDAVEQGLKSTPPSQLGFSPSTSATPYSRSSAHDAPPDVTYPAATAEIETGVLKLETLLGASADRGFDGMELYVMRNLLNVHDGLEAHVRLRHYEGLDVRVQTRGAEDLLKMRKKVQETKRLQAVLKAEHRRNQAVVEQLRGVLGKGEGGLGFLMEDNATALPERAEGVAAQLPQMMELLATMRMYLAQTSASTAAPMVDAAEVERRAYIESQTKGILKRRGIDVDLGESYPGRPVLSSGAGHGSAGRDDIGSMEAIANLLQDEKDEPMDG